MELMCLKNVVSNLDVYDHKFFDVFGDENCLFNQMALLLHYEDYNNMPTTVKGATKFMKRSLQDYHNNNLLIDIEEKLLWNFYEGSK